MPTRRPAHPTLDGFRHVSHVTVEVAAGGNRYRVRGIGHRLPVERWVPASVATRLAADGVPFVVHREDAG